MPAGSRSGSAKPEDARVCPGRICPDRICLGVVIAAHGVRGQVRVKSFTETPADIAAYGPLSDESGNRRFEISVGSEAKAGVVIARLQGVEDRNAAEALKGLQLYVERAALPELDEEEVYYHADLVGLVVEDRAGRRLGRVRAVQNYGAGDLLELVSEDGGERTLPFTRAVVPFVDLPGGRLVVELPPESGEPEPAGLASEDDETGPA